MKDWRQYELSWFKTASRGILMRNSDPLGDALFGKPPLRICAWCGGRAKQNRKNDGTTEGWMCRSTNCRTLSSLMNLEEWLDSPVNAKLG